MCCSGKKKISSKSLLRWRCDSAGCGVTSDALPSNWNTCAILCVSRARLCNLNRNSPAHLFEPGEVPAIGEILALLWLCGLDNAIIPLQKDAFVIRFLDQRKALSIGTQPRIGLNKINLADLLQGGEAGYIRFSQFHLPGPAATGGATLALIKDGHKRRSLLQPGNTTETTPADQLRYS